jgi:murein DD-endopeptidase MepM/ murein hydrolase activator NlpD
MGIFSPEIMAQRVGYYDVAESVKRWRALHDPEHTIEAPFADPDVEYRATLEYHKALSVDWSYGGWLEDRSMLWPGTYLEKEELYLHLGVDVSVPAGTKVFAPNDGEVVYRGDDTPEEGGWGRYVLQRFTYRGQTNVLVYGHLARKLCCNKGLVQKGQPIGTIGEKHENGGWAPHLHLQLWGTFPEAVEAPIEKMDWRRFLDTRDGYGKLEERERWAQICPDPTPLIFA